MKNSFRKTKYRGRLQRYRCKECNKKFINSEKGFVKVCFEPSVISEAINLVMSGMSYRNTAEHLSNARDIALSHVTVGHWIKKYSMLIKEYVDVLKPTIGNVWSVDEKMINVRKTEPTKKGYYDWLLSAIDPKTRFLLATKISKTRNIESAKDILDKTIQNADAPPEYVVTDSLPAYDKAINRTFGYGNIAHIKTNAIKDGFTNLPIERYHNEISANLKVRRGLDNDKSAQIYADLLRIHHNFIKPHMGLDGKTPAFVAGLDDIDVSKKYQSLINAATSSKRDPLKNIDISSILGDLVEQVKIICNNGCVRIAPKGWMDNAT